ncbi:hypothetical protein Ancab_013805 [Ancistrocladus abbreviatus]
MRCGLVPNDYPWHRYYRSRAYSENLSVEEGKQLHGLGTKGEFLEATSGYLKSRHFGKAFAVFLEITEVGISIDSTCWATVFAGCSESRNYELGL